MASDDTSDTLGGRRRCHRHSRRPPPAAITALPSLHCHHCTAITASRIEGHSCLFPVQLVLCPLSLGQVGHL